VSLSDSQASDAVSAFQSNYDNGGNYTSATLAAIDSIQNTYNPNVFAVIFSFLIPFIILVVFVLGKLKIIPVTFYGWGGSSDSGSHGGGGSSGGGAGGHF